MKVLLDTNVLLWWYAADGMLSPAARDLLSDSSTIGLVSAASAWEICTKVRIGKLSTAAPLCQDYSAALSKNRFQPLAITVEHGRLAGRLPGTHKDPFDRMLAAQALTEGIPLVTNDAAFAEFGVTVLW